MFIFTILSLPKLRLLRISVDGIVIKEKRRESFEDKISIEQKEPFKVKSKKNKNSI